jgi:hypothetical protein
MLSERQKGFSKVDIKAYRQSASKSEISELASNIF